MVANWQRNWAKEKEQRKIPLLQIGSRNCTPAQANGLQKAGVLGCKTWKFATTYVDFAHLGVACFQLLHHVFVVLFVDDELFVNDEKRK